MESKLQQMGAYAHRVRRTSTEIAIAAALTLAAVAFLAATFVSNGGGPSNAKLGSVASEQTVMK